MSHEILSFDELRRRAQLLGEKRLAVVVADDEIALRAANAAVGLRIVVPVLLGSEEKIREKAKAFGLTDLLDRSEIVNTENAAATSAAMAGSGEVDLLLKGHLRTDELLRAILDKSAGLRTGRLLSDVMLYEDKLSGSRLVGVTDGGLNVQPNFEQKKEIVINAIEVMRALGRARPLIAAMSATEAVSESIPSSVDALRLTELSQRGEFGDAEVFGPLALDGALSESAARSKGIQNIVAGHADCMVVPNIEAGNLLGKAAKYLGGSQCAHVVVGAKVPILIPSRVESADDKVNSIALGVLFAGR